MLQSTSSILIMNSIGSVLGPLIIAPFIGYYGGVGFFLFAAVCMVLGAAWSVYRIRRVERPSQHEHRFQAVPKTSVVVAELVTDEPVPAPHAPAVVSSPGDEDAYPGDDDVDVRERA